MAIPKLYKILEENGLFVQTTLKKCKLVIDGGCLVYSLLIETHKSDTSLPETGENWSTKPCDGRLFGGDYAHFASLIDAFFGRLQDCQITPIIVYDGTFPREKLRKKQNSSMAQMVDVISNLGTYTVAKNSYSLWYWHLANRVIKKRNLFSLTCFYEADEMIVQLAATLGCPILTSDSDFYLYSTLPGGIIPIWTFTPNIPLNPSADYLDCHLYLLNDFLEHEKFKGISQEMLTLLAPLLGQDAFRYRYANIIVHLIGDKPAVSSHWNIDKVYLILGWLQEQARQGLSFDEVKQLIMSYCDRAKDSFPNWSQSDTWHMERYKEQVRSFTAAQYTTSQQLNVPEKFDLSTVETFYERNRAHFQPINLFDNEGEQSTFECQVLRGQIQSRFLGILCHRYEFCPMLLEDYSRFDSSHYCYFAFNRQSGSSFASAVYGLLREENENPKLVTAWRRPHNALEQFTSSQAKARLGSLNYQVNRQTFQNKVEPSVQIGSKSLPMLKNIRPEMRDQVCELILETVGIDKLKLKESLAKMDTLRHLSAHQQMQLRTMMMALIYFNQFKSNCPPDKAYTDSTRCAFIHALLANLLLVGQIGPNYFAIEHIIHLDKADHLKVYETVCNHNTFNLFITHLYQTYQNCLSDLTLLAEILNLRQEGMNADEYVCALQGTFIHNLTVDLAARENVDSRLEEILGSDIAETIQMLFKIVSQSTL